LKAWLSTGLKGADDPFTIIVDWMLSAPAFITDNQTISKDVFAIKWQAVEDADIYVLYENDTEIYNGTGLRFTIADKTNGVYRYRVQSINTTAGASQLSMSLLITVDVADSILGSLFFGIGIIVIIFLLSILIFVYKKSKLKLERTRRKEGNEINKDEKTKGGE
jgi:hypothetical protein